MKSTIIAIIGVSAAALLLYQYRKGILDKANALLPPELPNTQLRDCNCEKNNAVIMVTNRSQSIFPNGLISQYNVPAFSSVQKK